MTLCSRSRPNNAIGNLALGMAVESRLCPALISQETGWGPMWQAETTNYSATTTTTTTTTVRQFHRLNQLLWCQDKDQQLQPKQLRLSHPFGKTRNRSLIIYRLWVHIVECFLLLRDWSPQRRSTYVLSREILLHWRPMCFLTILPRTTPNTPSQSWSTVMTRTMFHHISGRRHFPFPTCKNSLSLYSFVRTTTGMINNLRSTLFCGNIARSRDFTW